MIKDITFGQYFRADSVVHKLDPRMKLVLLILMIVFLFLSGNAWSLLFCGFSLIFVMLLSRIYSLLSPIILKSYGSFSYLYEEQDLPLGHAVGVCAAVRVCHLRRRSAGC